jgi:hypothetical protein
MEGIGMVEGDTIGNDPPDDREAEAFRQNRERWAERLPHLAGWQAPTTPKRVAAMVAHAATLGCVLDYSPASGSAIERYIRRVEQETRMYLDLDDDAEVGEHVYHAIDLPALGAYYGELYARHAGAIWTVADGHDGPEPAVVAGGVTAFPLAWVRWRVDSGSQGTDLGEQFRDMVAKMVAGDGA